MLCRTNELSDLVCIPEYEIVIFLLYPFFHLPNLLSSTSVTPSFPSLPYLTFSSFPSLSHRSIIALILLFTSLYISSSFLPLRYLPFPPPPSLPFPYPFRPVQVKAFGSFVSGLSLPGSDLDMVICLPNVHTEAAPEAPGGLEGRNSIKESWQQVLSSTRCNCHCQT